jgi:hypothetical protein
MILINSAKFIRAEFDLSKETFFVGSNAGGKTTSTRALHFLYNSDPRKLGIPSDKTSFKKHYYPFDDSYIIYTFEDFFILTYKRGDEIHRYFSKQVYDKNRIFSNNNTLNEHDDIIKYVKEPSWHHPKTIEEYTDILYGKNKKFIDFSISKIKHYETFIEILNLVFNVDKAIVDSISIKKAIQKALKRDDEIVTLDFEKYIRKLKEFETSYYFFKTFDKQRKNIDVATSIKIELLNLEEKNNVLSNMIQYRKDKEQDELLKANEQIEQISIGIEKFNKKKNNRKKIEDKKIPKLQTKVNELSAEIIQIEKLKEKYSLFKFEKNSEIANIHNGIREELQSKSFQLRLLNEEKISAIEAYDNEIKSLTHKIEVTIPYELEMNVRSLTNSEEISYRQEKEEVESEFTLQIDNTEKKIKKNTSDIEILKNDISKEYDLFREVKKDVQDSIDSSIKQINLEEKIELKKKSDFEDSIEKINVMNKKIISQIKDIDEKNGDYRNKSAIALLSKRKEVKKQIEIIMNQIATKPGTFQEYLSNEIINWEKEIYPIIDKSILSIPIKNLNPSRKENSPLFGIDIDTSSLETIPTPQEAQDKINKLKKEFYQYRSLAHEKFKEAKFENNFTISELESKIDENKSRINNIQDEIVKIDKKILVLKQTIVDKNSELESKINQLELNRDKEVSKINSKIKILQEDIKTFNSELKNIKQERQKTFKKLFENFEFNIKVIKRQEQTKQEEKIKIVNNEIQKINKLKKEHDENDVIAKLSAEVLSLEEENTKCIVAKQFLKDFESAQSEIEQLNTKNSTKENLSMYVGRLKASITNSLAHIGTLLDEIKKSKENLESSIKKYKEGSTEFNTLEIEFSDEKTPTEQLLVELIKRYKDLSSEYKNKKADLKSLISKISELESYPLVEVDLSLKKFDDSKSIKDVSNIIESLNELEDFKLNKYESQKKRSHREFNLFLKNTLPQKLTNFGNLENEFLEVVDKINKNLKKANFGVVRDISLQTNENATHKDSIGKLFEKLSIKIKDSANLYSKNSLFFHDVPRSVKNIEEIIDILSDIKKRGTEGTINLFDAIDLSMSYVENGKKNENRTQIKNDSSSGGNILLKVAIAISILNIYYTPDEESNTPFYLIIDEVSRLQHKNQNLLREYINNHGFKTLFITPDALYPDLEKAIYYIFRNIEKEGESLKVTLMNKAQ